MTNKTAKQLLLEVQLDWQSGTKAVISSNTAQDITGVIHVGTHPELGGTGEPWTGQHLFLGAISSCFMSTFFEIVKRELVDVSHFQCNVIGQIQTRQKRFRFTEINLYPKVYITDETLRKKINLLLQEAFQNSIVINSIGTVIFYHAEVLIDQYSQRSTEKNLL